MSTEDTIKVIQIIANLKVAPLSLNPDVKMLFMFQGKSKVNILTVFWLKVFLVKQFLIPTCSRQIIFVKNMFKYFLNLFDLGFLTEAFSHKYVTFSTLLIKLSNSERN